MAADPGDAAPFAHHSFWSSQNKETFQRGIDPGEITALARRAGLAPAAGAFVLPLPGICHAVLTKPRT
ncbi:hypothetical protein OG381_46315 [Streptomyces sp. NBC_00490]|uniref:hypothetical protein n=1 Tax=Streptomyces sp. NBC_00490 TaxID=2903657 RepID=UPI002E18D737